jgi:hypothetical protein
MEKEFIEYEQALALKELGFESPYPIGGYQGGKVFYYEKGELYYDGRPMYSSDAHSGQLLAPLYQQAFRWFREKKIHSIVQEYAFKNYMFSIDDGINLDVEVIGYDTYEEAELECLKKLIEIVKKQQEYESNIIV